MDWHGAAIGDVTRGNTEQIPFIRPIRFIRTKQFVVAVRCW